MKLPQYLQPSGLGAHRRRVADYVIAEWRRVRPVLTTTELAAVTGVSPRTLHPILVLLEDEGVVRRQPRTRGFTQMWMLVGDRDAAA